MIRLLLPSTLLSLVLHGFPTPSHAKAIVQHRSSGGAGSGYYDQSSTPYPPYSGERSGPGGGQSYTGKGKQPAYDPPTGGQGFPGGGPPRPPERPGEGRPPGAPGKKPAVEKTVPDELVRKYEVPGREVYNAWLMAATAWSAGTLMSQDNALGPDPRKNNWARGAALPYEFVDEAFTILDTTGTLDKNNLYGLRSVLQQYQVGGKSGSSAPWERRRYVNTEPYDGREEQTTGANIRLKMEQNKPYNPANRHSSNRLPALGTYYETTLNIVDGVILAEQYEDLYHGWMVQHPRQSIQLKSRPSLYTWSDLTWYLWVIMRPERRRPVGQRLARLPFRTSATRNPFQNVPPHLTVENLLRESQATGAQGEGMGAFLNYIVVTNIQDPDTLNLIVRCLGSRLSKDLDVLDNTTFAVGHWCFYALLGTRANRMIAEFLAQHRGANQLGHKVLLSATITHADPDGNVRKPAIIWRVSEDVAGAAQSMSHIESQWLPPVGQRETYCYPEIDP
ncbi:unnamed protein product [Cercospora beticola]|nr:unnamed protein product [Cercospora beticola]